MKQSESETILFSLRMPKRVNDQIREIQKQKPHLSLNAIIVEILSREVSGDDGWSPQGTEESREAVRS